MKVALYTISYQGLWYAGNPISLERLFPKVADIGYDGISLSGKKHHASPLYMDKNRCGKIRDLAKSTGLEIVALDTYTNFMDPVTEHREAQMIWLRELIKMASDLDIKIVKIFAGWKGTILRNGKAEYSKLYESSLPMFASLQRWNWIKECIQEAVKWAEEYGVVLAFQNHGPPMRLGYEDTLAMIQEIDSDYLKLCLDIGLGCFDISQQSDEYIAEAVQACRDRIVYSHFNGKFMEMENRNFIQTPYDIPGLTPPGGVILNYEKYIRELQRISYDGYIAYEVCGPVIKNYELKGIEETDQLVKSALGYMKNLTGF